MRLCDKLLALLSVGKNPCRIYRTVFGQLKRAGKAGYLGGVCNGLSGVLVEERHRVLAVLCCVGWVDLAHQHMQGRGLRTHLVGVS